MKWIKASERLPEMSACYCVNYNLYDESGKNYIDGTFYATAYFIPESKEWQVNAATIGVHKVSSWLDESDRSDEEAAFEAGREEINTSESYSEYKFETFTDYLKSKQEL